MKYIEIFNGADFALGIEALLELLAESDCRKPDPWVTPKQIKFPKKTGILLISYLK